jgi:heme oxygenase
MLHQQLKAATQQQHERLHEHPLLRGLGTGEVSRAQWLNALYAFYAFYAHYEPQVQQAAPFEQAPVLDWLMKDFTQQGVKPEVAINRCYPLEICGISDLVAYAYIKQGSTLGGQIISRKLRHSLGLIGGHDQFFFYGYGACTGEKWKLFLSQLQQQDGNVDCHQAQESAKVLFATLSDICDRIYKQDMHVS